jgi:Fe2+ transport system protein B
MSNQKSLTNHQLGIALASLMENFEKNQKQTLHEQKEILQAIYQLEKRINHSIANSKLTVDCTELKKYNDVISKTSENASNQLNKALKGFFLNKYLLIFFGFLFLTCCFMVFISIKK